MLMIHVLGAAIGLISGFTALAFRKGGGKHAVAGTVFFVSMLAMTTSAAFVAAFLRPNRGNELAAILTLYLVATAWLAAKRRQPSINWFDWTALVVIAGDGLFGLRNGFRAASNGGKLDQLPAMMYFIFGTIALLFAISDIRMIRNGGVAGSKRIARHLWRMCLALAIAVMSFYPGQAKLFSMALRKTNLLFMPHVVLIGVTLLWLYRTSWSRTKRVPA